MFYFELTNENIDRSRITSKGQWLLAGNGQILSKNNPHKIQVIEFFTK